MAPGVLGAALTLAEQGIPCFPVWPPTLDGACSCVRAETCDRPAKHPVGFLAPNGLHSATTDSETLRRWCREEASRRAGPAAQAANDRERLKLLEREVKELRRANEILRKASAYFAMAELDRHGR